MNKEKPPKSERSRRPQPNAKRVPPRPPSQTSSQQPPTSSSSIFGSLRRLKAGVTTSTPKKPATFYADLENRTVSSNKTRSKKNNVLVEEEPLKIIDNNANNVGTVLSSTTVIADSVEPRKKTRDTVRSVVEINRRPIESRRAAPVTSSGLRKDKAKSSTVTLQNLLRNPTRTPQNQVSKPKRPVTVAVPSNITIRRGHKEGQAHPDNISRTSSITNLDSLESNLSQGKGAKPRKVVSKERIDKQGQDGKKVTKNNNKLEPPQPAGPPLSYSSDSLQETELHHLKKQLRDMADEKSSLALQLGEQRGQLNVLQKEISKLKSFQEESNLEMEKLAEENTALRNRLRDVAHSPLSDNEKQQLLFESRHHSSAPASIATNVIDDNGGDTTACTTPDWDKHSSGNVSEVSVACLQDKINQMQETHYSTNEELQATLQELTDLQRQLTELQQENERLNEEKTLMFDSLCRQTERLNDSRQEVENLKQLLYRDRTDENGINQFESVVEREQKLVELLRSAQEEREQFLLKLEQIQADLHESRAANIEKTETISQLTERVRTLECTLDAKHAEHKQLDQELAQAKDQCSGKQIEINRLSDLLENARTKINELEQDRTLSDKSELDELLDNARKEKDQLESEVTYLKEQLARSKNELEKLKEQVFVLQEECKVTRNNAKTTQADLEYKNEKLLTEKTALAEQLQQFQEAVNELQVQAQCHLEDKRQLSAVLSETQRNMSEAERKTLNLENEVQELRKLRAEENEEWEKFQNDLLTSVRVANDFKTEAQQELQKIILENKTYRERVRLLEGHVEKLKGEKVSTTTQTDIILTPQIVSLARNLDPSLSNRFSLQEHYLSTSTENMEKLFPVLSRRSKSKDNIADTSTIRSSASRRQKSRDNSLERSQKPLLKKSKSKDNLEQLPVELKASKSKENITEFDTKAKGNRGFLKWNKSKDNLEQYGLESTNTPKEKKSFFKRNKSQENLDKIVDVPRKSLESSTDSNKSDPKPAMFSKFNKKREKKPPNRSNLKFMSVEEEMLLKSLSNWYDNIDENIPDQLLSEEDKAVKKLKILFEDEALKEKPIAHKPKEHLAISKPLLNSVVLNPKLEQICRDPKLITVDSEVRQSALEEPDGRRSRLKSEEIYTNIGPPGTEIYKSKSLDDINVFEEYRTESEMAPILYRPLATNNLTNQNHLTIKYNRISNDIQPNDSVSNPRHSAKFYNLPKPNVYINYENLDEIVDRIPKNVSENKLTEEQKFAIKLKQALDEAEKKNTLKKFKKGSIRGLEISAPTKESVERNWKLKEILMNPNIKKTEDWKRHSTDISSDLGSPRQTHKSTSLANKSKSYEDISFSFVPENTLLNMYYGEKIQISKFNSDNTSSSSQSFSSGTFNLDTGNIEQKCNITIQDIENKEDLFYNETLAKKEKRNSNDDHPKIKAAKNKYKVEVQQMLKRIESEELRSSLRKKRLEAEKVNLELVLEKSLTEVVNDFVKHEQEFACNDIKYQLKTLQVPKNRPSLTITNPEVAKSTSSYDGLKKYVLEKTLEIPKVEDNRRSLTIEDQILLESVPETIRKGPGRHDIEHVQEEKPISPFEVHFDGPGPNKAQDVQKVVYENVIIHTPNRYSTSSVDFHQITEPETTEISEQNVNEIDKNLDFVNIAERSEPVESSEFTENTPTFNDYTQNSESCIYQDDPSIPVNVKEQIFKENQYGVVSPLDLRHTYRTVVKEYKVKYSSEDTSDIHENLEPLHDFIDEFIKPDPVKQPLDIDIDDLESVDDFIDEFFEPIEAFDGEDGPVIEEIVEDDVSIRKPDAMSQIDKEMNDIMDKYLHTRASLLVKNNNETAEQKSNFKKYVNCEDLQSIKTTNALSPQDLQNQQPETVKHFLLNLDTDFIDNNKESDLIQEDNDDNEPLSLQDLEFIEEMKAKYASTDTIDTISIRSDKSLEDSNIVNLRPPKDNKSKRPLSEINDKDLMLIEELTKRALSDDSRSAPENSTLIEELPPLPISPIPSIPQSDIVAYETLSSKVHTDTSTHLNPSLRPKKPTQLPLPKSSHGNEISRNKQQRYSYQESSSSPANASKRLSDLMFKETIFVPISTNLDSPMSPKYKQESSYKEKIFIASPDSTLKSPSASKIPTFKKETIIVSKESPNKPKNFEVKFNKYSSIPQPSRSAWSNSLKKNILDSSPNSYEPVYSNVNFKSSTAAVYKATVVKKPLPLPRESSFRVAGENVKQKNDVSANMSESTENFSKEIRLEGNNNNVEEKPILSQDAIKVEESKAHTDILKKLEESEIPNENVMSEPASTFSEATIDVDSKNEGLNICTSEEDEDVEEIPRSSANDESPSNINLFNMESHTSNDSYLELFKSKESKDFDILRGKNAKAHFSTGGLIYVEDSVIENTDSETIDNVTAVRPKIIDFVPLDDKTTPVFTKQHTSYDTLEREKTFQVLEEAALKSETKDKESVEVIAQKASITSKSSSKSHTNAGSRASFTQAKQLFEALAEANKDERPKTAMNNKPSPKTSIRDSWSLEQMKTSLGRDGTVEESKK